MTLLQPEEHGRVLLDGTWNFLPGDCARDQLESLVAEQITVRGLWEAQGHLELDGIAWYRERFTLAFADQWWTLQGISDRLQLEVLRRHDHIGGYCLTELTDVPHELNGLLDLHRRPKPLAVDELRRGNQPAPEDAAEQLRAAIARTPSRSDGVCLGR